ncbi:hypothetical protein ACIODS_27845 [Micromonospora chalcea]|uniref:hypothetical protein n=1 Tax=Micromonospora TaxID=1873 RepID=UPI00379B13E8
MSALRTVVEWWAAAPTPTPAPGGGGIKNPLDGVTPDMGVLGGPFTATWVRVAGAIWALMIAVVALYVGAGFVSMAQARQLNNSHMMSEATSSVKLRLAALGGVVLLPLIIGAVIAAVG